VEETEVPLLSWLFLFLSYWIPLGCDWYNPSDRKAIPERAQF